MNINSEAVDMVDRSHGSRHDVIGKSWCLEEP